MADAEFEGIHNFRDFGGYEAGGRQVVRGRLFRSGAPSRATPQDLARLGALGVSAFVDLRRWSERQAAPALRPDAFAGSVVESIEQDVLEAPHDRYLFGDSLSFALLRERILDFYRGAPFDPQHRDLFRRAFEAIAAADGAILVHCAVGKDRTGLFVSLLLHLLGVGKADLMREYLLSRNDRRMIDALTAGAIGHAEDRGLRLTPDVAQALTSVFPDNLETAWSAIEARHGSVEDYLADLGVAAATAETLRARLLV